MLLLQCTATLLCGNGQWKPCNALPHRLEALGSGNPVPHCRLLMDVEQCYFCHALPRYLGAVGSGKHIMHCHTAKGRWAMELLQCNLIMTDLTPADRTLFQTHLNGLNHRKNSNGADEFI